MDGEKALKRREAGCWAEARDGEEKEGLVETSLYIFIPSRSGSSA
jgi:hypothetical protein